MFEIRPIGQHQDLVRVPPASPLPQAGDDGSVHFEERGLTGSPVIISPASNNRVEQRYQDSGSSLQVSLDDSTDFSQECFHIVFLRLGEKLGAVLPYILS
jgi:hypothetical protein